MTRYFLIAYIALLIFGVIAHGLQALNYKLAAGKSSEPYGKLAFLCFAESVADVLLLGLVTWLWSNEVLSELWILYIAVFFGGAIMISVKVMHGRITGRPFFKI